MKLLTLAVLLILTSHIMSAEAQTYVPANRDFVRQQMGQGQERVRREMLRNEYMMDTQEAMRYGRVLPPVNHPIRGYGR